MLFMQYARSTLKAPKTPYRSTAASKETAGHHRQGVGRTPRLFTLEEETGALRPPPPPPPPSVAAVGRRRPAPRPLGIGRSRVAAAATNRRSVGQPTDCHVPPRESPRCQ